MIKKGYKVVNNDLKSAFVRGDAIVQYIINKKIYPHTNYGPLCVYDSLEHAIEIMDMKYNRVFECEYKQSSYKIIWKTTHYVKILDTRIVLADWIKLVREITNLKR